MEEHVETPIGRLWLDSAGILWHRLRPGVHITKAHADETLAAVRRVTGGSKVPAVIDMRGVAFADREARNSFAGSSETSLEVATALIVDSSFSRNLGNLFLKFSTPQRPVKMFTTEESAVEWVRGFLA